MPAALITALPLRVFGIMASELLLAIPFFTFMGLVLERSGLAEEVLDTAGELSGGLRGGLALSVVAVGALLAATTGVVAAAVISIGTVSLPVMLRQGYNPRIAAGVVAAAGGLTQIVPPSLSLDRAGRSARPRRRRDVCRRAGAGGVDHRRLRACWSRRSRCCGRSGCRARRPMPRGRADASRRRRPCAVRWRCSRSPAWPAPGRWRASTRR